MKQVSISTIIMMWVKLETVTLFLLLCYATQTTCNEIITLENSNHVVCITDNIEDPIYVEPPQIEVSRETSFNIENELVAIDDDWIFKDSLNTTNGPILDKRWEDLEIIYTNYTNFLRVKSLSFSIYRPKKIEFFVDDDEYIDYYSIEPSSETPWVHYTLFVKDGNTYLYEIYLNNSKSHLLRRHRENFQAIQFVVRSYENTYWKIHKYSLKEAEQVSESPTTLLFPKETQCSVIYTTLCPHCFLEVEVSEGEIYRIDSSELSNLPQWKQLKISESSITSLNLKRGTTNGESTGYWALDVRNCPSEISTKVTYETTNGMNIPRTCKLLSENKDDYKKRKYQINPGCKVGWFGQNCDVNCEALLGSEKKYCEGYRICENDNCNCAWGFEGESCTNSCSSGKWGLSCESKCVDCESCDQITGTCADPPLDPSILEGYWKNLFICSLFIAMSIIIVVGLLLYYSLRCRKYHDHSVDPEKHASQDRLIGTIVKAKQKE